MASRKSRGKIWNNIAIKEESGEDAGHEETEVWQQVTNGQTDSSFELKTEDDDSDDVSNGSLHSAVMSLDVLAQVATDQLKRDPRSPSKQPRVSDITKISKRSLLNMDFLHLDQIRTLSPKFLVNLFGELTSNEITRNYSYTCFLIPEKCSAVFTSFGSEIKAREQMKRHLKKHIDDLIKLKSANEGFSFIAETVVAKKKRQLAEKSMRRKKSCWTVISNSSKKAATKGAKKKTSAKRFTGLKHQRSPKANRKPESDKPAVSPTTRSKPAYMVTSVRDVPTPAPKVDDDNVVVKIENDHIYPKEENSNKADGEWDIIEERRMPFKRTGRNVERNENIIWDILSSSQPYHDHSYTTVFGKRKAGQAFEEMAMLELDEEEHDDECRPSARTSGLKFAIGPSVDLEEPSDNKPVMVKVGNAVQNQMHIPLIKVEFTPTEDGRAFVSPEILGHSINRPYPPMPKSDLAQKGRLPVPEEQISSSEEDTTTAIPSSVKKNKRKFTEGSLEWERRLALKYIRELRMKKKDDDTHLVCKICKDKTFTATATLMYHYRSHAGIKPFVCLICNTTFTRQHSLNYHMLIHNNQSRFTCVDCGRKFRHPSHFKEHLRRHTGETPFHCMDCPVRFKTRNTYKRHLKTRHGKLLTANGIRIMPPAEFLKVQTKHTKSSDDYEDFEEVVDGDADEDEMDHDGETNQEEFDSDKEDGKRDHVKCGAESTECGEMASSKCDVTATNPDVLSVTDTSASNKLLQLCSQLVKQEVC